MNQLKKSIAADLKAAGYNTKQVSVRLDPGSSRSIKITIRDPHVVYSVVEGIGEKYKHLDYDKQTSEILTGGNTYIDITLNDEVHRIWAANYLPLVTKAISELKDDEHGVHIDSRFIIFPDGYKNYKIWDEYDSWLRNTYFRVEDLAIDLYILTSGAQAKFSQAAVCRYWCRQLLGDKNRWQDTAGEYNTTAMGEEAAVHFKCASEQGDTELEKEIFDWVVDFVSNLQNKVG